MKKLAALGVAGGFLLLGRGWLGLLVVLWIAARVSHELAIAILKEVLKSGLIR